MNELTEQEHFASERTIGLAIARIESRLQAIGELPRPPFNLAANGAAPSGEYDEDGEWLDYWRVSDEVGSKLLGP